MDDRRCHFAGVPSTGIFRFGFSLSLVALSSFSLSTSFKSNPHMIRFKFESFIYILWGNSSCLVIAWGWGRHLLAENFHSVKKKWRNGRTF